MNKGYVTYIAYFSMRMHETALIYFRSEIWLLVLSWQSFYRPTEDDRPSRPMHCSKRAQPMPKAVYRSGYRDIQS